MLYEASTPEEKMAAFQYAYDNIPGYKQKYKDFGEFVAGEGLDKSLQAEQAPVQKPGVMDHLAGYGKALGAGLSAAVGDVLPETLARVYRGGDYDGQGGGLNQFIKRQSEEAKQSIDPLREDMSIMGLTPKDVGRSLSQIGFSIPGMVAGIGGGAVAGPVGAVAAGGAAGAATGYLAAKDQLVEMALDDFIQKNPGARREQVGAFRQSIESEAQKYGTSEALWEGVGQAVTAGLLKLPAGKLLQKLRVPSKVAGPLGFTAKTGVDVGAELAGEGQTQVDQGGVEYRLGLRDTPPPANFVEGAGEVWKDVVPMQAFMMGLGGGATHLGERMAQRRQERAQAEADAAKVAQDAAQTAETDRIRQGTAPLWEQAAKPAPTAGLDAIIANLRGVPAAPAAPVEPAPFAGVDAADPSWTPPAPPAPPAAPTITDYTSPATDAALEQLRIEQETDARMPEVRERPERGLPLGRYAGTRRGMLLDRPTDPEGAAPFAPMQDIQDQATASGENRTSPVLTPTRAAGLPINFPAFQDAQDQTYVDPRVPGVTDLGEMPLSERMAPAAAGGDRLEALKNAAISPDLDARIRRTPPLNLPQANREVVDGSVLKERITAPLFEGKTPARAEGRPQELTLTGGMSGSGKTTAAVEGLGPNEVYINPDALKRESGRFEESSHRALSSAARDALSRAIDGGFDATYDTTLSNFDKTDKAIKRVFRNGGIVNIDFTEIAPEVAVSRIEGRMAGEERAGVTKRTLPTEALSKSYNRSLPTFLELFKKYRGDARVNFDLFDNSVDGQERLPIFSQHRGEITINDQEAFDRLISTPYKRSGGYYERQNKLTEEDIRNARAARGNGPAESAQGRGPSDRSEGDSRRDGRSSEPSPTQALLNPPSPADNAGAVSSAPASSVPQDLILDKSGKPFKDKTISLAVANSIKRGKNVEAVQIGPNQWGMRPVVDEAPQTGNTQERAAVEQELRTAGPDYDAMREKADALIDAGQNVDMVYDVLAGMEDGGQELVQEAVQEAPKVENPAKEPWQMTKAEAGVGEAPSIPETPRPLAKVYGPNWESRPDAVELKKQHNAASAARSKALKVHKRYVERSNAHLESVKQALADGKDVPAEVVAEYPFLDRAAAPKPQAAEAGGQQEQPKFSRVQTGGKQRLAPNGKPSNLNAKQHEQVRSAPFRRWAGNWMYDPKRQVEVVEVDPTALDGVDLKDADALEKWVLEHLPEGGSVHVDSTGSDVGFSNTNLKASIKRRGAAQRKAYAGLRDLIAKAEYFNFEPTDERHAHRVVGQDVYFAAMSIGGNDYSVKIKVDVAKKDRVETYKDHKVSEIQIAPVVSRGQSPEGEAPRTSRSGASSGAIRTVDIGILTGGVKPSPATAVVETRYSSRETPAQEPLVLYFGSSADLTEFKPERMGNVSSTFGGNQTVRRTGVFMAENPDFAAGFADQDGDSVGNNIMPVFADIKDPILLHVGLEQEDAERLEAAGYDTRDLDRMRPENMWMLFDGDEGAAFVAVLKKAGYDGAFIAENDPESGDEQAVWVAFSPTQIKSATGNNGQFDGTNPDIRFKKDDFKPANPLSRREIDGIIASAMREMANAAPVVSYDNAAEASRYLGFKVPADARAFFWKGEVHIMADQIGSKQELAEAIVHEQLRHHGFKALLGKSYRATMKEAWSNGEVRRMARDLFMNQGYKDIKVFNEDGSIKSGATISEFNHAADEAIAHLADKGWKSSLMDRIIASVRQMLRRVMPDLKWSDAEIKNLISASAQEVLYGERKSWAQQVGGALAPAYQRVVHGRPESRNPLVAWTPERLDREIHIYEYSFNDKTKGAVAWVNPEKFLNATSNDRGAYIKKETAPLDEKRLADQEQSPFLTIRGNKIIGHEGRHRMAALAEAGYTSVPVVLRYGEALGRTPSTGWTALDGEFDRSHLITIRDIIPLHRDYRDTILERMQGADEEARVDAKMLWDDQLKFKRTPIAQEARDVVANPASVTGLKGDTRNDMARWQKALSLPHWIAKQFPEFAKLYDRQMARVDERMTKVHDAMEAAKSFYELPKTSLEDARKIIWAIDGKKIEGLGSWMKDDGTLDNGRKRMALNEDHYAALEQHLKDEFSASDKVAKAVADVRRSLDQGWVELYNKFASKKEAPETDIATLRSQMGKIHNYFPHKRYGDYYIKAVDPEGKTVYREHFDMLLASTDEKNKLGSKALKKRAEGMVAKLSEKHPGYSWEYGDTAKLPEAVFEYPVDVNALQQIVHAGVHAGVDKLPEGTRKDMEKMLEQAFADVLKERGFGANFIQRQNVPGHEMQDVRRVFHDHLMGLHGFLTKMDAARDFTTAMRDVDAKKNPRLYEYSQQFMQDMLQNAGKVDQVVAAMKAVGFVKYLGLRLPTAALNLTQNIISGIPVLSMHTSGAAGRYFWTTAKDIVTFSKYALTGRMEKAKGMTPDEAAFLKEAYASGHTQAAFVEDMQLRVADSFGSKAIQRIMQVAGYPMAVTERFNRATLALAAYRAAKDGKIVNKKTLKKFGLAAGQKADAETAGQFARMVTDDAHFVYGKANMPQPLRGSDIGKIASTSYQFRRFSHNMLGLYAEMMRSDRGKQAMLRHIGGLVALGGLASVPLYKSVMAAIMAISGDDGEEELRKMGLGDLAIYGLPSLAGITFSGSMGLDLPVVSEMADKKSNPIWDILGIPGAFVRETQTSLAALKAGRVDRAIATSPLTPSVFRNAANAIRLEEEGAHTLSGRPIPKPGEKKAMKLTPEQTWAKILGFAPVELTKAWKVSESLEAQKEFVDDAKKAFANRYVNALNKKDTEEAKRVRDAVRDWNNKAIKEKKRHMIIDLRAAVQYRQRAVEPTKAFRGRAKEMMAQ
jgi:predicted ABC-type ATPase